MLFTLLLSLQFIINMQNHYIVVNNRVIARHRTPELADLAARATGGQIVTSEYAFRKPIVSQTPEGIRITEGWTPPAAERIAFLNRLKAQLLDKTTALQLPPETVVQLAVEMQKFSLLADIGADETLYFSLQQLPPDNPVINGEIKDWLLAELRNYIRSYKPDFE